MQTDWLPLYKAATLLSVLTESLVCSPAKIQKHHHVLMQTHIFDIKMEIKQSNVIVN